MYEKMVYVSPTLLISMISTDKVAVQYVGLTIVTVPLAFLIYSSELSAVKMKGSRLQNILL